MVAGHAVWILPWPPDAPTQNVLTDILENGTAMFLFVAGFLFQHLSKKYTYRDYITKKFKNVIVPYLLLATPSALEGAFAAHVWRQYPQLDGSSAIYRYLWFMIKGGAGNNKALWFVPMITLFYLAAPLFMQFIKRPKLYLVLIALVPLSVLAHRGAAPNLDTLGLSVYYLPVYLLGMWASQYRPQVEVFLDRFWAWLLAAWALMTLAMILFSNHHGNYEGAYLFSQEHGPFDWLLLQKVLLSFALLGLIRQFEEQWAKPLEGLAESSFTIFFLHCYVLDVFLLVAEELSRLTGRPLLSGNLLTSFIAFLIGVGVSYGIAVACQRMFGKRSRYLVGS